jgi:hypothetical protein
VSNLDRDDVATEWAQIEQPLLGVDPILDEFAKKFGLKKFRNFNDWPCRVFDWDNGVRCQIQLYLVDCEKLTFNLWLCASQDRGTSRFWRHETPIREQRIEQFADRLADELQQGRRKLIGWTANPAALEFAAELDAACLDQ